MPVQTVDDTFPATRANIGSNCRGYNFDAGTRTAVGAASSAAIAIGAMGQSREIMMLATTRCFIRFGNAGVAPATVGAGQMELEPGERFHQRVQQSWTHFTVIRDTADGFLSVTPVA